MRLTSLCAVIGAIAGGSLLAAPVIVTGSYKLDPRKLPKGPVPHIDVNKLKLPGSITGVLLDYDFKSTPLGPYMPEPVPIGATKQGIEPNYAKMTIVPPSNGLTTRSAQITTGDSAYYTGPYFDTPPVDLSARKLIVTEWTGYIPAKSHVEFHLFTNHFEDLAAVMAYNGVLSLPSGSGTKPFGTYDRTKSTPGGTVQQGETFRIETDLVAKTYTVTVTQEGKTVATSAPQPLPSAAPAGPTYLFFWVMFPDGGEKPSYQLAKVRISGTFK